MASAWDFIAKSACLTACRLPKCSGRRRVVFAYAGDFSQFGGAVADVAALAVEGDGEAVCFVASHLHQVEHWKMMVEHHGSFSCPQL
jgi:hypothetical protein